MKLLGKGSVASVLKVVLDVFIAITAVAWFFSFFLLMMAALSGNTAPHDEFVELGIPYNIDDSGREVNVTVLGSSFGGMALGMDTSYELTINLTKWWFLLLLTIYLSIMVAVFIFILIQLRRFLATLTEGSPFTLENARRIRIIGIIIIAGNIVTNLLRIGGSIIINSSVQFDGAKLAWPELIAGFSLPTIFLGIVVLMIAEIFRLGVRMREEQELTI